MRFIYRSNTNTDKNHLISHQLYYKTNLREQNFFHLPYIFSLINNVNKKKIIFMLLT